MGIATLAMPVRRAHEMRSVGGELESSASLRSCISSPLYATISLSRQSRQKGVDNPNAFVWLRWGIHAFLACKNTF